MILNLKLSSCATAVFGSAVLAFGLYNIHSVSGVTEGGVLGLTLLLHHWLNVSPSVSGLILNILCFIIGYKALGREFLGYSIFAIGSFSLFYAIFEMYPPLFPQLSEMPIIAATLGAVFVGVGVGICVRAGGAPSGDDALAMSLSHILRTDMKWIYLASDVSVLLLSLTYIPLSRILYSLLTVVLSGQIISYIQKINFPKKCDDADWSSRDVLVGTLRNHAQLECCIRNKFYHIPAVRLGTEDLPVRYVAIYQSRYKFGVNAGIRYFGEVTKCSLVPRHEIREIPRDSDEMYYRFDIKEWQTLPKTIVSCESDFVSITTTRFLLENSSEVPELMLQNAAEYDLYKKITARICGETFTRSFPYGKATFSFVNGVISITVNSTELFTCTFSEFSRRPSTMFRRIMNILETQP